MNLLSSIHSARNDRRELALKDAPGVYSRCYTDRWLFAKGSLQRSILRVMRSAFYTLSILIGLADCVDAQWKTSWDLDSTSNQIIYSLGLGSFDPAQPAQTLTFLHPLARKKTLFQFDAVAELGYGSSSHVSQGTFVFVDTSFIRSDTTFTISPLDLSVGLSVDYLHFLPISAEFRIGLSDIITANFTSNNGSRQLPVAHRIKFFYGIAEKINLSLSRRFFAEINVHFNKYFSPDIVYDSHGSSFPLEMGMIGLALGVVLF